jgi:hypothetical protein
MGEPPRKRAEPLFYDDTHRAIHESWKERHPEVFQTLLFTLLPNIALSARACRNGLPDCK